MEKRLIDVNELMEKIRAEIAQKSQLPNEPDTPIENNIHTQNLNVKNQNMEEVRRLIASAEGEIDVGTKVTSMEHFRYKLVRYLAQFAGKIVLYLARFITVKQRRYNRYVVDALKQIINNENSLSGAHHETRTMLENKLNQLNENYISGINNVLRETKENRINIIDQQRRLTLLLEEARKRFPEKMNQEQIKNMISEEQHLLDAMYVSFEDRFRGTREEIKNKQAIYLPFIKQVINKQSKGVVLDVGCGRCEWLELLKENDISAIGVDINRIFVEQAKENGYEVVESDVIEYLCKQKANSISAITGFHIVEHLDQEILVKLLDESLRVLQVGGIIIFETPNPENIIVGACNFYTDPTHKKPIPPNNLLYLTEARGFCGAEILRLHPDERLQNELKMLKVNDSLISFFTKEQDYSIIAYKNRCQA